MARDNIIAVLARLRDHKEANHRIIGEIAGLDAEEQASALNRLLILAALRRLADTVEREIQTMPVLIDIMENTVLGPRIRKGIEQGREQRQRKGELLVLHRIIEKRCGAIPAWAEERLSAMSSQELEDLSGRVLDVQNLQDLLR